jgi:arabinogalactan oligomer/maltooligosaccharide transport system permease protein
MFGNMKRTLALVLVVAMTVALGLFHMIDREHITTYFSMFTAGAVLVSIPIVALFISMQRFYVEGITGGSVKG